MALPVSVPTVRGLTIPSASAIARVRWPSGSAYLLLVLVSNKKGCALTPLLLVANAFFCDSVRPVRAPFAACFPRTTFSRSVAPPPVRFLPMTVAVSQSDMMEDWCGLWGG